MKAFKYKLRKYLNLLGIDAYPYDYRNSVQSYLEYLFKNRGIDEVWDVGANVGQYAQMLRMLGFKKKIISFEALPSAYKILELNAKNDKRWVTYGPQIISDRQGEVEFYETENGVSSSMLKPLETDIAKRHFIPSRKLSEFLSVNNSEGCRLLKMDVQGSEKSVLESCGSYLQKFNYVQLEASIQTSYEDEMDYISIIRYMENCNYKLIFVYPGVADADCNVVQIELFFSKNEV